MHPTARRFSNQSLTKRLMARRRGGFTLVEMMVSVTLVMLMMLMFAEIFGLATETISKQKGIATNDQKARILAEVLRKDLENRTFLSVYPFKLENPATALPLADPEILQVRRGYFSYSENDPNSKTDDTLQFTIELDLGRIFGKAFSPVSGGLVNGPNDGPAYDDGRSGGAGASKWAEVSYYLRDGNLYRSVLLIRKPYFEGLGLGGTWGQRTPDGFPGSFGATVVNYPGSFWNHFDYSAFRETAAGSGAGLEFHGRDSLHDSLSNNFAPALIDPLEMPASHYVNVTDGELHIPRTLGAPQLRFGHSRTDHGQPFEFSGSGYNGVPYNSSTVAVDDAGDGDGLIESTDWTAWRAANPFFGRFNSEERSDSTVTATYMSFPGTDFGPFATANPTAPAVIGAYEGTRRGVDLMLPNVQGFDVQIWDDILGQFVDLGYGADGNPADPADVSNHPPQSDFHYANDNPYTAYDTDGNGNPLDDPDPPEFGFYHISRLRESLKTAAGNYITDAPSVPADFGNRYDTWCPNMWIVDAGGNILRNGRAPYRPLQANPDPNTANFNTAIEPSVAMGDKTLDDDNDGIPYPTDPLVVGASTDAEAPLRAIRITVHYLDPHSGQTRQATIEQSLIN